MEGFLSTVLGMLAAVLASAIALVLLAVAMYSADRYQEKKRAAEMLRLAASTLPAAKVRRKRKPSKRLK